MKKFAVILMVLVLCGSAFAETYPELGICTGENVRLRESPSTKGKIVGAVEPNRKVLLLLGEKRAGGRKWYEVEHPTEEGTAWIAADYVKYGFYDGKSAGRDFVKVRSMFGIYPEKARAILGAGKENNYGGILQIEYPDVTLVYDGNGKGAFADILSSVHIKSRKFSLCGIRINDRAEKLLKLGMPESVLDEIESEWGKPAAPRDPDDETPDSILSWNFESKSTDEYIYFQFAWDEENRKGIIDTIAWYDGRTLYGKY